MRRKLIVGIDEAGRGPLAGPITVGLVAAKNFSALRNIKDSKKLSSKQREVWFKKLKQNRQFLSAHASVGNKVIDKIGIVKSTARAVKNCLKKITTSYQLSAISFKLLLDGSLYAPPEYKNQHTIIKGDERIPIIAAASIIAKVIRDRKMVHLAKKYHKYSFEIHKGYGTKAHREAIRRHGMCDLHRRSFCSKFF